MRKERRQARMRLAVAKLTMYMKTYADQAGYADYSDKTFIDDVLYGLGVALGGATDHYSGPDGYERFKAYLRDHLDDQPAGSLP